jgi:hypothetical protein
MYRRELEERKGRASDFMKFSRRGHDMASVVNSGAWGGLAWPIPPSRTSNQVSINFHFLELQVSFFHCSFQGTKVRFYGFTPSIFYLHVVPSSPLILHCSELCHRFPYLRCLRGGMAYVLVNGGDLLDFQGAAYSWPTG